MTFSEILVVLAFAAAFALAVRHVARHGLCAGCGKDGCAGCGGGCGKGGCGKGGCGGNCAHCRGRRPAARRRGRTGVSGS